MPLTRLQEGVDFFQSNSPSAGEIFIYFEQTYFNNTVHWVNCRNMLNLTVSCISPWFLSDNCNVQQTTVCIHMFTFKHFKIN